MYVEEPFVRVVVDCNAVQELKKVIDQKGIRLTDESFGPDPIDHVVDHYLNLYFNHKGEYDHLIGDIFGLEVLGSLFHGGIGLVVVNTIKQFENTYDLEYERHFFLEDVNVSETYGAIDIFFRLNDYALYVYTQRTSSKGNTESQ
nr:MAG TPA: hypothetical protein [Caudoviricetes sp.]